MPNGVVLAAAGPPAGCGTPRPTYIENNPASSRQVAIEPPPVRVYSETRMALGSSTTRAERAHCAWTIGVPCVRGAG